MLSKIAEKTARQVMSSGRPMRRTQMNAGGGPRRGVGSNSGGLKRKGSNAATTQRNRLSSAVGAL